MCLSRQKIGRCSSTEGSLQVTLKLTENFDNACEKKE